MQYDLFFVIGLALCMAGALLMLYSVIISSIFGDTSPQPTESVA